MTNLEKPSINTAIVVKDLFVAFNCLRKAKSPEKKFFFCDLFYLIRSLAYLTTCLPNKVCLGA